MKKINTEKLEILNQHPVYSLRNKTTGKYYHYSYNVRKYRKLENGKRQSYTIRESRERDEPTLLDINSLNFLIRRIIDRGDSDILNNYEIARFGLIEGYHPTGTLNIKDRKEKFEAEAIISKLKNN